ncbi:MAG: flavoprotein [Kiritimatiellae bacterium]|nr:flavoprotein [Kiritimatiellia bacterium]MDD5521461.1 flavoprotein [Kiritimatiellia bacterium]
MKPKIKNEALRAKDRSFFAESGVAKSALIPRTPSLGSPAKTDKKIVLGVTGSIAAYKAVELLRLMQGKGWDVHVVMTKSAREFVTELTFRTLSQHPVGVEMFGVTEEWRPEHISVADFADVMVIAPCTANVIAKIAHGIADDLLTCTVLATEAPIVIAPAMNVKMWNNAATQTNVKIIKMRGGSIVEPGTGDLACGYQGKGRMASLGKIVSAVEACLRK